MHYKIYKPIYLYTWDNGSLNHAKFLLWCFKSDLSPLHDDVKSDVKVNHVSKVNATFFMVPKWDFFQHKQAGSIRHVEQCIC